MKHSLTSKTLTHYMIAPLFSNYSENAWIYNEGIIIQSVRDISNHPQFLQKVGDKYWFTFTQNQLNNIVYPFLDSKFSQMDSSHLADFIGTPDCIKPNYYKLVCQKDANLRKQMEYDLSIVIPEENELMSKINYDNEIWKY